MPKLRTRPPKLSKSGNYGYVYLNGERYSMGRWGAPETDRNYRRFCACPTLDQRPENGGGDAETGTKMNGNPGKSATEKGEPEK